MLKWKCVAVGVAGALALLAQPALSATVQDRVSELLGTTAEPLQAVDANRAAIVNRLVAEHRATLFASGIAESTFRNALDSLRADQLLAAALVETLAEITTIVSQSERGAASAIMPKDGPGSGANSWIGYTAGSNLASGSGSAVAAGTFNAATTTNAAVFAGQSNVASGISSLVIGGFDNRATAIDSLIGAGAGHRATGARSVVVGGSYNLASGQWSFIGGGGRDGVANTPAGTSALDNIASGNFSVITGGQGNRATGSFATVPGGVSNLASGIATFAAGNRAKTQTAGGSPVIHNNTFAFADGSAFDFNTAAANEFAVRATGGVRFVTAIDGAGLPTKTLTLSGAGNVSVPGNLNVIGTLTAPGLGTVTSLTQSSGITLTPNPITATGTIAVDAAVIQARVTGSCVAGSSIRSIAANGTVVCENDDIGTGTVTSVGTGAGLTGGPITASGTVNLSATQLLPTAACTGGQVPSWNGSAWACNDPSAFTGNITLPESTSASVGNIMKGTTQFIHNFGPGQFNTFVGEYAGNFAMTGHGNSGIGNGALSSNATGSNNTATGGSALSLNTIGSYNTASGTFALSSNTTGFYNTANGHAALSLNTTGFYNTAIGYSALLSNMTASGNTAIGYFALLLNTTGSDNTASGRSALSSNTTGSNNTASGGYALYSNTTGEQNNAMGTYALSSNTTGSYNTASGHSALSLNTTGAQNTAIGHLALLSNTTGHDNTASGDNTLASNTTGLQNTANGSNALNSNTTANWNTASGAYALYLNTIGNGNTASGDHALFSNTTGFTNTASGLDALSSNTTGANNIGIGYQAGQNLTTGNSNIDIGNPGVAGESGTIRIGDNSNHSRTFIAAIRGVSTVPNAVNVVIDSFGQLGTISSSRRFKEDISDMSDASAALMQLRPVTFRYKTDRGATKRPVHFGLIAEEVAEVYPGLVAHAADGQIETVMYQFLAPMLLNEYQKQQRIIESQTQRLAAIEHHRAIQSAEIAELRRAVEVLIARTQSDGKVAAAD